MRVFKVQVQFDQRELEFRISCHNISTAAGRALREMRKHTKGKKIKEVQLKISSLGSEEKSDPNLWPTEKDLEQAKDIVV